MISFPGEQGYTQCNPTTTPELCASLSVNLSACARSPLVKIKKAQKNPSQQLPCRDWCATAVVSLLLLEQRRRWRSHSALWWHHVLPRRVAQVNHERRFRFALWPLQLTRALADKTRCPWGQMESFAAKETDSACHISDLYLHEVRCGRWATSAIKSCFNLNPAAQFSRRDFNVWILTAAVMLKRNKEYVSTSLCSCACLRRVFATSLRSSSTAALWQQTRLTIIGLHGVKLCSYFFFQKF